MGDDLDAGERRVLRRKARGAVLAALADLGGEASRRTLIARAAADGDFTDREREAPADAAWSRKYRTRLLHDLSWALTELRRDGLVANPRRGVWALAGEAARVPEPVAAPVLGTRLEQLRAMPYREYLRSPEWRETRAAALHRAGHACMLDATHVDRLEVHHRSYERLGAELPEDLTVLCRDCHARHHIAVGRPRRTPPAPPSFGPPAPVPDYVPPEWSAAPARPSLLRRLLGG